MVTLEPLETLGTLGALRSLVIWIFKPFWMIMIPTKHQNSRETNLKWERGGADCKLCIYFLEGKHKDLKGLHLSV